MNSTSKLVLVPSEIAEKFNTQPLRALDKEMSTIIHTTEADDIKWKQYNQVLQKYLHLKKEIDAPLEINLTHNIVNDDKTKEPSTSNENIDEVDNVNWRLLKTGLTSKQYEKALKIYNKLHEDGLLNQDKNSQIILNKRTIKGSHINEILSYLVKSKNNVRNLPTGWNAFKLAIHKAQFPMKQYGVTFVKTKSPVKKSPYITRQRQQKTPLFSTPLAGTSVPQTFDQRRGSSGSDDYYLKRQRNNSDSEESLFSSHSSRGHKSRIDTPRPASSRLHSSESTSGQDRRERQWRKLDL